MSCLPNSVCVYVHTYLNLSATDIYNEIKRLSHIIMQQLTDIRLETFFEILRRFETTLNRIENLASTQKEQSDEIKGRVEPIEKSHALTEAAIARASTREQTLLDEMKTEVATVAREQASIKSEICGISRFQNHLQRKQDQIASKQDSLHSTIANEQRATSSVISFPLMSPPIPTWNHGVRTSIPEILPKSRNQSDLPMFSLQRTERGIQPPIVIDEELQSVLDDLSSIVDATSTDSLSFNLPTATEDPPSIQDQTSSNSRP